MMIMAPLRIDSRSFLFATTLVGPCWPNDRTQIFGHYCIGFIFETVHPSFSAVYARIDQLQMVSFEASQDG